jgi:hypothetical protein
MLYMVIEKYRHGPGPVYQRAAERGRMLPENLRYVDSWVVDDGRLDRCFQLNPPQALRHLSSPGDEYPYSGAGRPPGAGWAV